MSFFSAISGLQGASTLWSVAENYLSIGQTIYQAQPPYKSKTIVLIKSSQAIPLVQIVVKILSYVTILVPLLALTVRTAFRNSHSFRVISQGTPNCIPTPCLKKVQDSKSESQTVVHPHRIPLALALSSRAKDAIQHRATREKELCTLLSSVQVPLVDKKIIVFSKDLGGYGDFVFGFKALSALNAVFPGNQLLFISDSPDRSLQVKENSFSMLLPGSDRVSIEKVSQAIAQQKPDFLIVAPCTNFPREPLEAVVRSTPHMFVREYGWTDVSLGQPGDYVSGAGVNPQHTGIFINRDLEAWAEQVDSLPAHVRLAELRNLPKPIQRAILESDYTEEAVRKFSQMSELFVGYGEDHSKVEFMMAVARMHSVLATHKNLCFVFLGSNVEALKQQLEQQREYFRSVGVGKIIIEDPKLETIEIPICEGASRCIKCIPTGLVPSDTLSLVRASEMEILTTGDQSWGEAISAHKHWIQDDKIHKRASLDSVLEMAMDSLRALFRKAYIRNKPLQVNVQRAEEFAVLLHRGRTDPTVTRSWRELNHTICEQQDIQPWLAGMVIRKFLERDERFQRLWTRVMEERFLSDDDLLVFLQTTQKLAIEILS
jgi:hypothetical protein